MRNPPVYWHEGLFLRPQHFQAAERYWGDLISTSQQWDHPFHYGLKEVEFSTEALANHTFQVNSLKARMRDGTIVSLASGEELGRVDLKAAFSQRQHSSTAEAEGSESEDVLRIFLAVPKLLPGRENVSSEPGGAAVRFLGVEQSIPDENDGGNEQEIRFRRLNIKLLLSHQDASGYEVLPIAQVKRASAAEARPRLDDNYFPPVLSIEAWPGLGRDTVRAVYDVIGQKIEVLAQQISNRGIGLETHEPGDADRILMLTQLSAAYAVLGVLAFSQSGVHPLTAYTELCRLVGQLSIFAPNHLVQEVPPYDHDDLARIFRVLRLRLEELLNSVRDYEYEQRYFVGVGLGMQVTLEPKWFNANWSWYIGVKKGDLTKDEIHSLLSAGHLDWKLGSSREVEILFQQRAEGLQLLPVERVPRVLPASPDWVFYQLSRTGAAWRDVQETQTLAMRLRDSLIDNREQLQGERTIVVPAGGAKAAIQFALFAFPSRS
ncbi:MAG: type VI secretion system baseplate subunit TssK [Pirellulaceae bacterium]